MIWAISQNKYFSAKKLLELGANPNLGDYTNGTSAIIEAADKYDTSEYLKLVLKYGGNPNYVAREDIPVFNLTPLCAAAKKNIENVKLLLDAGAEIDYGFESGKSALFEAVLLRQVEIVHYLLLKENAQFDKPVMGSKYSYITNFMRSWTFPLDSKEYLLKMEIVDYLKERGMDYRKTEIFPRMYENYSKDYLEVY